jgi:hypothetical protein
VYQEYAMGRFSRLKRRFKAGWALGGDALGLVKHHPKLMVFPVISALAFVAIVAQAYFFAFPTSVLFFAVVELFNSGHGAELWSSPLFLSLIGRLCWLLVSYILLWAAGIFVNTALCGTILAFHSTGKMSLRAGLGLAVKRLPQIIGWAVFAATVGLLLSAVTRVLEDYMSWAGWLLGSIVETAWSVSVYFVAPVLAAEGVGPVGAVKRSVGIIKKQWGQMAGSEFSVFWRLWPFHLAGFACLIGLYAVPVESVRLICLCGLAAYVVVTPALQGLMSGIVCTNLYRFAAAGAVPPGSDGTTYGAAFDRQK